MSTSNYSHVLFDRKANKTTTTKIQTGGERYLQQLVLGKTDVHMQKNEIGSISIALHKN